MKKNNKTTKELYDSKLHEKLNRFNPSEAEAYLKVLLRKCLEATIKEDYLTLGNTEELLNKSILILAYKINNFNLFYSNLKLEVATEYLANYIDVNEAEAFKFLNVLPEFYEAPKETIDVKTAEEMLVKIKCFSHYVEDYFYCLETSLNFLYDFNLMFGSFEGLSHFTIAINSLISGFYERAEKAFEEIEEYYEYEEDLNNKLWLGSEKENETIYLLLYGIKTTKEVKEEYEEFKSNPFYKTSKYRAEGIISRLFKLKEPIEDIDSFKETLTKENDLFIVNWLYEGITTNLDSYDFKNFEFIPSGKRTLKVNDHDKKIIEKFIKSNIDLFKELPPNILENIGLNSEDIYKANKKTIRNKKFL